MCWWSLPPRRFRPGSTRPTPRFRQAELDFKRTANLRKQSAATQAELDAAQSRYNVAKAAVAEAEALSGYAKIVAPFDGVVARKLADEGDLAMPGKPLLELEGRAGLRLVADVPSLLASNVLPDAKLAVRVDTLSGPITGHGSRDFAGGRPGFPHGAHEGGLARNRRAAQPGNSAGSPCRLARLRSSSSRPRRWSGAASLRSCSSPPTARRTCGWCASASRRRRALRFSPAWLPARRWSSKAPGPCGTVSRCKRNSRPAREHRTSPSLTRHPWESPGRIARAFIDSKLTPLLVITSILLGAAATLLLPREEEPQIKVPMIDVLVAMPGFSAKEVEERATRPMEKLLWEIPNVEYIYSTSREGESLAIVRFKVGEDIERSLINLNQKLQANFDRIPQGVSFPLIKPKSIDDVPILALTFHGAGQDHYTLRRIVAEVDDAVKQVPLVAETTLIGGERRQLRVLLDPAKLASRQLSAADIVPRLQSANRQLIAGPLADHNREVVLQTGSFLTSAKDAGNVVVGVHAGKPVYLRDVATIVDGPEEPSQYVFFGAGAAHSAAADEQPAVTLSIAKRPGANAISVAQEVLKKVDALKGRVIPNGVEIAITRHYGKTAEEKSDELLLHMGIAVLGVSLLILLTLGWRESIIVGIAIPCTLALTLLVFYLHGYTLNRITLFALIFSIGILVDDAIVVVENIVRHFHLPQNKGRPWSDHRGRGGQRSRQPDHPRHLCRHLGGAADGVRRRVDGALHAADSHRAPARRCSGRWPSPSSSRPGRRSGSCAGARSIPAYGGRRGRCADAGKPALPFRARGRLLYPALPALHGAADCQSRCATS